MSDLDIPVEIPPNQEPGLIDPASMKWMKHFAIHTKERKMKSPIVKKQPNHDQYPRRDFLAGGLSLFGFHTGMWFQPLFLHAQPRTKLSEAQRRSLMAALEKADRDYDAAFKMIRSRVSSVGYHTTLKDRIVHPTRSSLQYAAALLASDDPNRLDRAKAILATVIALQDQNPESKTYGVWSWYLEEPLEKMSPPDWNWADFCGVQLLSVWIDHRRHIGETLAEKVKESIVHAARSIQRRNVGPGYTNIAVMGTYVTLAAADQFDLPDLREYAKARLRRLHEHIIGQGSFTEYNSPTYSIVAIAELSRMVLHIHDEEDLVLIRAITDLAWKHVATHFHPPTRQWAGPHSRCYSTDLRERKDTLAFLEAATQGKAGLSSEEPLPLSMDDCRLPLRCPENYIHYFQTLDQPREVVETFIQGQKPIVGATWLHPRFALGSVNQGDFWRQKRSLLAYWGTPEQPTYLHARFLHDDYDFCSALIYTIQTKGCALSTVVFATDYGDTHPSLDKVINATIRAKDLRLRFEFGAEIQALKIEKSAKNNSLSTFIIQDRDIQVSICLAESIFGNHPVVCEIGRNNRYAWIDVICHSGNEQNIILSELAAAFIPFCVMIRTDGEPPHDSAFHINHSGNILTSSIQIDRRTLHLQTMTKPDTRKKLTDAISMRIEE